MFGVDFGEVLVIFVVALVVLGPKRLPSLVFKVGKWVGKARTMARQFREQIENEINLEELNRMTDVKSKPAKNPPPPPGFNGDPMPEPAATGDAPIPDPNADTYSHAHAADAPPMADVFPADPDAPAPAPVEPAADAPPADAQQAELFQK
ncbi:MAG: Sec-independent protein translocase protein TatB [Pseudomonadota bacterium]